MLWAPESTLRDHAAKQPDHYECITAMSEASRVFLSESFLLSLLNLTVLLGGLTARTGMPSPSAVFF